LEEYQTGKNCTFKFNDRLILDEDFDGWREIPVTVYSAEPSPDPEAASSVGQDQSSGIWGIASNDAEVQPIAKVLPGV